MSSLIVYVCVPGRARVERRIMWWKLKPSRLWRRAVRWIEDRL